MRSALTSLGIIIGVASVIALVGIGGGASAQIEARIASLGTNLVMVLPGSSRSGGVNSGLGGAATLKPDDAKAIAREIPFVHAVSPELRAAFIAAMKAADADDAVGAVVITGAGNAFSAGQDLNETANLGLDQVRGWCAALRNLYQSVRDLSKPAVAAWNGIAAGAGMQIGLPAMSA